MNTKTIVIIVAAVVLIAGLTTWFVNKPATPSQETPYGITFRGIISNTVVTPMTLKGMGVYDRSCVMGADGLTSCDAGIQTEEWGVLNFKYRHNMQQQPCLAPNDIVQVRILDNNGNAEIQRMA